MREICATDDGDGKMKPVYLYVGNKHKFLCRICLTNVYFKEVCFSIGGIKGPDDKGRYVRDAPELTCGRVVFQVPRISWNFLISFRVQSGDYAIGGVPLFEPFPVVLDTEGSLVRLDCNWPDDDHSPILADDDMVVPVELEFLANPQFFEEFYDRWKAENLAQMEMNDV